MVESVTLKSAFRLEICGYTSCQPPPVLPVIVVRSIVIVPVPSLLTKKIAEANCFDELC